MISGNTPSFVFKCTALIASYITVALYLIYSVYSTVTISPYTPDSTIIIMFVSIFPATAAWLSSLVAWKWWKGQSWLGLFSRLYICISAIAILTSLIMGILLELDDISIRHLFYNPLMILFFKLLFIPFGISAIIASSAGYISMRRQTR